MKVLLTLFVLFFSSSVVAEDISDFEIEGMSIGDSLLDYFSEKEITNADTTIYPKSKSYYSINLPSKKDSKYESYVFAVKANDKKYTLKMISGMIDFKDEINECNKFKDSVIKEIQTSFSNSQKSDYEYIYKTVADGKSIAFITDFEMKLGFIRIYCIDWSNASTKEMNFEDSFSIDIDSHEHLDWINNEAY